MHVIAEIAVLLQSGSPALNSNGSGLLKFAQDVWNFVSSNWSNIVKITLALATLLSTGGALGGRFGFLERFIAPKRKSELLEQIGKLSETMSKMQELPEWAADMSAEIKTALKAEMEIKLSEFKRLQSPTKWEYSGGLSVKNWFKYCFLWWRPRGFSAWCFHLSYYLMLALVIITSLIFLTEILSSAPGTHVDSADVTIAIILYTILGVPTMVVRFFAAKIHRHQCDESLPA